MSDFFISITKTGTKKYPLHQHPKWEIMYYLKGEGYLATQNENIPFKPGGIIIVPPGVTHGSVSQNGFVNISIGGDFSHLLLFDYISVQMDNENRNGERLARLIYDNRYVNIDYLSALCSTYAQFLLHNSNPKKRIIQAIRNIIEQVSASFTDPCFDITALLNQSGYAEDYIRAEFKKSICLSPFAPPIIFASGLDFLIAFEVITERSAYSFGFVPCFQHHIPSGSFHISKYETFPL
jgi:hypothetical protein